MTKLDWKAYEEYAKKTLKKAKTPGAVVSIALDGKPIYTRGFGYRDIDRRIQPDSETIFGIGSVTKSFTAVAVMHLQEQGKLRVDREVLAPAQLEWADRVWRPDAGHTLFTGGRATRLTKKADSLPHIPS